MFGRKRGEVPLRLHIGSGPHHLDGWVNIDNQGYPGVDRVLDVREGLPYSGVASIYAEHFLEHLPFDEALAFLAECRRALLPDGVLRLSTPNLDWVLATHYNAAAWKDDRDGIREDLRINRAFHGWGHHFLYNRPMLSAMLRAAGFSEVSFHRYGESPRDELRHLEAHETWVDTSEMPHVLIAEARGVGPAVPLPEDLVSEFRRDVSTR